MTTVDFTEARKKHLDWRTRLRSFLDGHSTLTESEAVSHKDCALGQWLYSGGGFNKFRKHKEMRILESDHEAMHATVKDIVRSYHAGDIHAAEESFKKIEALSQKIVANLTLLEAKINSDHGVISRVFGHLSIKVKLVGLIVIFLVLISVIGGASLIGNNAINDNVTKVLNASHMVDAAMEMKVAVAGDKQVVMEMLNARGANRLDGAWQMHEANVKLYDLFVTAILEGAETSEGTIKASRNDELRNIVEQADGFHNDSFQPIMVSIHDAKQAQFAARKQRNDSMAQFESLYDQAKGSAEEIEASVKQQIARGLQQQRNIGSLFQKENGWADMAMEIKTTLGELRIAVEEYAQSLSSEQGEELKQELGQTQATLNGWITALLHGGSNAEGTIIRVDDANLRQRIEALSQLVDLKLRPAANRVLGAVDEDQALERQLAVLDKEADAVGNQMMTMLDGVEDKAGDAMDRAVVDSDTVVSQLTNLISALVLISLVVGTLFGSAVYRAITKPLALVIKYLRQISSGDLRQQVELTSTDEMGELLAALKSMSEGLRNVVHQVSDGSHNIASAASQISAANDDLSKRTEEEASSLEETASSIEQLTSNIKETAANAEQATQFINRANESAINGAEVVTDAVVAMGRINDSSKQIESIITAIDDIAFQTNLLALNAAVEAARVGEQGRGFAVVAGEVRELAQRSAGAAHEIKELIDNSVALIAEGKNYVDASGDALNTIRKEITTVVKLFDDISFATQEQAAGIDQINSAVSTLDEVTQQNASMVEEAAAASRSLAREGALLKGVMSYFKLPQGS